MVMLALTLAINLVQSAEPGRDWAATLRQDALAMHAEIAANHPGMVNRQDPSFAFRNDAELSRALGRAERANSYAHYFYALQEYAASFDDGHLAFGVFGNTPDEIRRWPGFLTRYDVSGQQHVFVARSWSRVPVGARLISCDGKAADEISKERVGARFGRWQLAAQRQLFGAATFLDTGNPHVRAIETCRFRHGEQTLTVPLTWRAPAENLYARYIFPPGARMEIGTQRLNSGVQWISLPSFNGDPDSPAGQKLRTLLADLERGSADLHGSRAIVFDLRGNGGGSSDWSYQIARKIWGESALARLSRPAVTVSWRASKGNLNAIREGFAERSRSGHLSPEAVSWYRETIAGLEGAIAARQPLWTTTNVAQQTVPEAFPAGHLLTPVYVLTDSSCMSACLDAVDLWTSLGAVPIGQETNADTLYMEVRAITLPSGVGQMAVPMKVYSGRSRGSNEPVRPRHVFGGDIGNTRAVQQWVSMLPELRGSKPPASSRGKSERP